LLIIAAVKENTWDKTGEIPSRLINKWKVLKSTRAPNAPTTLNFRNLSRSRGFFTMLLSFMGD
jgi:hypothetical protein